MATTTKKAAKKVAKKVAKKASNASGPSMNDLLSQTARIQNELNHLIALMCSVGGHRGPMIGTTPLSGPLKNILPPAPSTDAEPGSGE